MHHINAFTNQKVSTEGYNHNISHLSQFKHPERLRIQAFIETQRPSGTLITCNTLHIFQTQKRS